MLSARPNPTRRPEQTPPVVAVLPHPDDRELLQFGLALSHGDRTRLRAWTFHDPGRRLHPALRIARFGMATRSEADRAIRHLVDSAVRGAHVPVRPFSWDDEARAAELAGLGRLPEATTLIVGRVRGRPGLEIDAVLALAAEHPGPVAVVVAPRGPAIREVLATSAAPHEDPAHQALVRSIAALELAYPTFRVRLDDDARLTEALEDARETTLVFAAVDDDGLYGALEGDPPLWERHPGTTALLFPPGGRLELLGAVLDRLADDESPPPRPVRPPPRWVPPSPPPSEDPDVPDEMSPGASRSGGQETQ